MKRSSSENGNVIVEFIGVTVALLVPLSIIASSCIQVANAYLSTEVSARTAARAFVVSSNDANGNNTAKSVSDLVVNDFDLRNSDVSTKVSCTKTPCLSPGGYVTVQVSKSVKLNLPSVFGPRSVVVTGQHTSVVDELRVP